MSVNYLPAYKSLAKKRGQPYSFGPKALEGKKADLGPRIYGALYQGSPVSTDNQMFPPECWGVVKALNTDEYTHLVTAWDTAAKDKPTNDPSCNVVVGRRKTGDFVVLDMVELRVTFDKLLPIVIERDRAIAELFRGMLPLLVIESASSGQQLIDLIKAQFPRVPIAEAKPVKSKIVRAESVTPFTMSRRVSLLEAPWNAKFVTDHANFPASESDHCVDAFAHAIRAFVGTGSDFKPSGWSYLPPNEVDEVGLLADYVRAQPRRSLSTVDTELEQIENGLPQFGYARRLNGF